MRPGVQIFKSLREGLVSLVQNLAGGGTKIYIAQDLSNLKEIETACFDRKQKPRNTRVKRKAKTALDYQTLKRGVLPPTKTSAFQPRPHLSALRPLFFVYTPEQSSRPPYLPPQNHPNDTPRTACTIPASPHHVHHLNILPHAQQEPADPRVG